jgi:eukaryotic-like serine/threonine-protein kinase
MPQTNADDPLRTTDRGPSLAPPAPDVTTEHVPGPSVSERTRTHLPAQDAEPRVAEPERGPQAVAVPGYDIECVLGRGGMGVVYKARHLALKRTVALKMVLAGGHAGPAELARFRSEAEVVARLHHPNIVQVFEVGEAGGHPYCALEFVEGGNLASQVAGKALPSSQAAQLAEALARAVQLAHSRNVVHRDLKPANVLLAADGTPKITDFGLARQLDSDSGATQAGQVMGTPSYMAPEQASGRAHEAGPAADVYALGAILYECLAGRPPFRGQTVVETLDQVRTQEPARLPAGVPADLATVCLKCLRKEPERRYASAAELADDLVRYQRGEPIRARPVGHVERGVKWVKRNPWLAGAAAAATLALVGGATVSYLKYLEAAAARNTATEALAGEQERGEERDKANYNLTYQLGVSSVVLASAAYDNRDVVLAAERLENVPEKQRGWEWRYLNQQARGGLFTLYGHTRPVTTVTFSQDGERIVTASMKTNTLKEPCQVKVWDARTGTALLELNYRFNRGASQPFSLGGTRLATADLDNAARLWDARTGKLQRELKHTSPLLRVVLSPDGSRVATVCRDGMVKVWDADTGKPQWEFKGTRTSAAFSPDSTRLIIGPVENQKVLVCDAGTGKPLLELSGCNQFREVAFSPDKTRIVIGSSGQTKVWDAEKGGPPQFVLKRLDDKGLRDWTSCVAFSPDGARILTGGGMDEKALVWDARTATTLFSLKGRLGPKTEMDFSVGLGNGEQSAAFSPDSTRIVTVGGQSGAHEATVWDARTGVELLVLTGHTNQVLCAAFSPDGTRIVTGSVDGTAKVWDARTGTGRLEMNGHWGELHTVAVCPDGTRIISGGGEPNKPGAATVWNARTGVALLELKGFKGTVKSAAFSRDGTRLVTGEYRQMGQDEQGSLTWTGEVKVWDARTGAALLELKGFKEGVNSIAISPDGSRIITAAGGPDGTGEKTELKVWDASTGAVLLDLTQEGAEGFGLVGYTGASVAFSPDGTRFVAGGLKLKGTVANGATVRDAETGAALFELKGHWGAVLCVAYSPDGTRIVTGGGVRDHRALVWDAETGTPLPFELKGHTSAVLCAAFSPDGKRIVTGSVDRTVRVWDAKTGTALVELKGFTERVMSVAFSADGASLVTGERGGAVTVWDARSVKTPPILKGHTGPIAHMAFSPDGTRIITSSRNELKVWDARTGAALFDLKGHTGDVYNLAFSTDGTRIVSCDGTTAKVWDTKTGSALLELKGKAEEVQVGAFSPDGKRIVTGGFQDDGGSTAKGVAAVWDARAGTRLVEVSGLTSRVEGVAISPNGTRLFTYLSIGPAKAWDAGTGKEVPGAAIPTMNSNERLSPDGRIFARVHGEGGTRVELIPLQPDEEELACRQLLSQANVGRYRDGHLAARAAQDEFVARFYLNLLPPPEQKVLTAQAAVEREIAAGRTQDALVHLAIVSAARPEDTELALKLAALRAWFDQDQELADMCGRALESAKGTSDPTTALTVARVCCLGPSPDKARQEAALALARKAVELDETNPFCRLTLGIAEYRSGHFKEADAALLAATTGAKNDQHVAGPSAFFRAMSLFRQGKPDEARKLATEAAQMARLPKDEKNPLADNATTEDLILWLAYKEAKALIGFGAAPPGKK